MSDAGECAWPVDVALYVCASLDEQADNLVLTVTRSTGQRGEASTAFYVGAPIEQLVFRSMNPGPESIYTLSQIRSFPLAGIAAHSSWSSGLPSGPT